MDIGIIIFIISIIISGVSALRDKSHEQRQNQRPPQRKTTSPNQKPKQQKGFFEQIEEAFSELEKGFSDDETTSQKRKEVPKNKRTVYQDQQLEREILEEQSSEELERSQRTVQRHTDRQTRQTNSTRGSDQERQKLQKELESELVDNLYNVRAEIDREKEKQLTHIENRARSIISDKNLSERTKRFKLKQLLNSKNIEQNMTHEKLQFDSDPVINGVIWQEILNKPKQL
ncbi:hypothetical protein [Staphylococcus caledonicus]|uniref:hypothetical protein n=1 Tax=Staphylococcus caledonicus TaxID=2741333 RepID=UPI0018E44CBE|nr:hypothetical protein [Staphylococcus caledonicus]MBI5972612.1 hypothetical protein [Staphylococcus caledonicus]